MRRIFYLIWLLVADALKYFRNLLEFFQLSRVFLEQCEKQKASHIGRVCRLSHLVGTMETDSNKLIVHTKTYVNSYVRKKSILAELFISNSILIQSGAFIKKLKKTFVLLGIDSTPCWKYYVEIVVQYSVIWLQILQFLQVHFHGASLYHITSQRFYYIYCKFTDIEVNIIICPLWWKY